MVLLSMRNPLSIALHLRIWLHPLKIFPLSSISTPKLNIEECPFQSVQLSDGVSSGT